MRAVVVIGAQWGDEGKGKIVDLLAGSADIVVRFQGGNNAGHTMVVGSERVVLHLIPSGALWPDTVCVIGNGVVLDPEVLFEELAALRRRGALLEPERLRIAPGAHLVMPYHKAIDRARERLRGKGKIGTTGRGIGPAYEDKAARVGIRVVDLLDPSVFREKLAANLTEKNFYLQAILGEPAVALDEVLDRYGSYREALRVHVADTGRYLREAIDAGRCVLFEGAQGTMLDVDHGTYPFVTSSTTLAAGVASGVGVAPLGAARVVGISKAYTTRVGSGPFPTEIAGPVGERLRRDGDEFGATTGRPRRCGWFDAVAVRYAARLSGLWGMALTKLDVLSGIDPLQVCVAYEHGGDRHTDMPVLLPSLEDVRPVYQELPGWHQPLGEVRRLEGLPTAARRYVDSLVEWTGVPLAMISVGARRDQTIVLSDPFAA